MQDILPGEGRAPLGLFTCDTHPLSKFFSKDSWGSARWRASLPQSWYKWQIGFPLWLGVTPVQCDRTTGKTGTQAFLDYCTEGRQKYFWNGSQHPGLSTYHIPCVFRYRENICYALMNGHLKQDWYIWLKNTKIPSCSYPINWYSYKHIRLYSYNDISLYHIYQVTNG